MHQRKDRSRQCPILLVFLVLLFSQNDRDLTLLQQLVSFQEHQLDWIEFLLGDSIDHFMALLEEAALLAEEVSEILIRLDLLTTFDSLIDLRYQLRAVF